MRYWCLQISNPNGDIMVTNDGATILRSIIVDNPAAKVLIDISKTQDEEVGDGTTSVTVLTGELLREAERLIGLRIHPMTIIDGWRRATTAARGALEASSLDHSADEVAFKADLMNIARTTLSSKLLTHEKDQFAQLAVDAVLRIKKTLNLEQIQIIKRPGGSLKVRPTPIAAPPLALLAACSPVGLMIQRKNVFFPHLSDSDANTAAAAPARGLRAADGDAY
jgi:T-complex protein 1 subunit beta